MEQVEFFLIFTERLEQAGITYMATGSVASMLYGIPRFTHDIDLVIDVSPQQVKTLSDAFPLEDFYCPPDEVLQIECRRPHRGHFNVIHHETGFKADFYVHREDELQAWGLARRRRIEFTAEKGLWTAPPEYVIVRKLDYFREGRSEKHLLDIRGMLEVSGDLVDLPAIAAWAARLGLQQEWSAANSTS